MSRGQATVERGFSVNANVIVKNLREEIVVAQRIVHDRICEAGVLEVPLSKCEVFTLDIRNCCGNKGNRMLQSREAGKTEIQ